MGMDPILPWKPLRSSEDTGSARFWKFADSPFTWGGLAVLITAASSPSFFVWVFTGSGIAIWIGLMRAHFFRRYSRPIRIISPVVLSAIMAILWFFLWKWIPKPVEAMTKKDVTEAVRSALPSSLVAFQDRPVIKDTDNLNKPLRTKEQVKQAVKQVVSTLTEFSNLPDQLLAERAKRVADQLIFQSEGNYVAFLPWLEHMHEAQMFKTVPDGQRGQRKLNQQERDQIFNQRKGEGIKLYKMALNNAKPIVAEACQLREEILDNRLEPWEKGGVAPDAHNETLFDGLCTTNKYEFRDEAMIKTIPLLFGDLPEAAAYLRTLNQKFVQVRHLTLAQ